MDKCWQLTFDKANDKALGFLESFFSALTEDYEQGSLIAYAEDFNEKNFLAQAKLQQIKLPKYSIKVLESNNWLRDNPSYFPPFETDTFFIHSPQDKKKTTKIALETYAETAFGFNHPTTQSCLNALVDLHKAKVEAKNILDVGTGSGILAMASAKLWPQSKIIAVDIDRESIKVTQENANNNNIKNIITDVSNGYHSSLIETSKPYDLIIANILAKPLIEMAHNLETHLKKGGFCVLSGFNKDQIDWVVKEHQKYYLSPVKTYEFENWRTVLMEKLK